MKMSERLKAKVENDLGISVASGPHRIWGARGAAHRWRIETAEGHEYSCEDTMRESVATSKLGWLDTTTGRAISIE